MGNIFRYEDFLSVISSFLKKTTEGLAIIDFTKPPFPVFYVNNGFVKLTGYSFEDVEGKDLSAILFSGSKNNPRKEIYDNLKNFNPFSISLTYAKKDGKLRDGLFSFTPVDNSKGNKQYFFMIVQDITDKKQQIEKSATIKAIKVTINSVNDIVFNYMTYLKLFHDELLELNGDLNNQQLQELLNEYDYEYRKTFEALSKFGDLKTFNTKMLSEDFEILDL